MATGCGAEAQRHIGHVEHDDALVLRCVLGDAAQPGLEHVVAVEERLPAGELKGWVWGEVKGRVWGVEAGVLIARAASLQWPWQQLWQ